MDGVTKNKVLLISNNIQELSRVACFVEELGEEWALGNSLVFSLNLVLEEALSNTILYGFDDSADHTIEIFFSKDESSVSIIVQDDGIEYDPTLREDPDITLSAEERPVGGLGVFLIKKIMDSVHYERLNNKNNLILIKNI